MRIIPVLWFSASYIRDFTVVIFHMTHVTPYIKATQRDQYSYTRIHRNICICWCFWIANALCSFMLTSSNGNFSALLALCQGNHWSPVNSPSQRSVTRGFDVFFDLRLNKRLCKQSRHRWFETPSRSQWRHCYAENSIKGGRYAIGLWLSEFISGVESLATGFKIEETDSTNWGLNKIDTILQTTLSFSLSERKL